MTTSFPLSWPEGWPRTRAGARAWSRFKTGYIAAYDNLIRQLQLLGAGNVVVSSNAPLRRDGKPYTDAMNDQLEDPGVAVYFKLNGEPRVMARDGHPTPAENLHAIGHVIEALRSIDRHGGGYMMSRAFSAFAALPAPGANVKRPWHVVLGFGSDAVGEVVGKTEVENAYRRLSKKLHPDMAGGSHEAMAELNTARAEAIAALDALR